MTTQWPSWLGVVVFCAGCTSSAEQALSGPRLPDANGDASGAATDDAGSSRDAATNADVGDGSILPRADATAEPDGGGSVELQLDHVQMRGTHNSYHLAPVVAFDDSHRYSHAPLDEQLADQGVRVLELDLHRASSDDSIDVYHITAIDPRTTCLDFEDCLGTLVSWSDSNPGHVPIMVWVEIKDSTGGPAFENLDAVDTALRSELGDKLFTPDDLQGQFGTLRESIAEGWPKLDGVRGKFIFIVLSEDADIDAYSAGYTTLEGRAMFVRVGATHFDSAVAAFCKLDVSDTEGIQAAHTAKLMIATNVCTIERSDEECEQNRQAAIERGIHMLKDDLPAPIDGREYYMALPEGNPVACNPVRAPEACTAGELESL